MCGVGVTGLIIKFIALLKIFSYFPLQFVSYVHFIISRGRQYSSLLNGILFECVLKKNYHEKIISDQIA